MLALVSITEARFHFHLATSNILLAISEKIIELLSDFLPGLPSDVPSG